MEKVPAAHEVTEEMDRKHRPFEFGRIDTPAVSNSAGRYNPDHVPLEPVQGTTARQEINTAGMDAGIEHAADQRQCRRPRPVAVAGEDRGRSECGQCRLAEPYHVHARTEMTERVDKVGDIVVEAERPAFQGNIRRIRPRQEMNVVIGKHAQDHVVQHF